MDNFKINNITNKKSKVLNLLKTIPKLNKKKGGWKMKGIIDTKNGEVRFSEKVFDCNLVEAKKIIRNKFKDEGKAYIQLATTL